MSVEMYYVGHCPVCKEGVLGIRACGNCQATFVICDECDAMWETTDVDADATYLDQPDLPCPHCESSLNQEPSHWATWEEIESCGWTDAIEGEMESSIEVESGFEGDGESSFDDETESSESTDAADPPV